MVSWLSDVTAGGPLLPGAYFLSIGDGNRYIHASAGPKAETGCFVQKASLVRESRTGNLHINAYTLDNTSYTSGGSGLICTLDDYFKFAKMLANGGKTDTGEVLASEKTLKRMSMPQLNDAQLVSFPQAGDTCLHAEGYSYGYGVHVMRESKNHLPVGEWGWAGTMGTWLSVDPQNGVFWVYAHQVTPSDYGSYIPKISKLIYASLL